MEQKKVNPKTKWAQARRAEGKCIYCAQDAGGKPLCSSCRQKKSDWRRDRQKEWKQQNSCLHCGKPNFGNKSVCETHYYMSLSSGRLGKAGFASGLKMLVIEQNGHCALTGDILTPDNMELDHICASSAGGINCITNVRWVTKDANRAKQHLSDEELLALCQKIVAKLSI